MSKGGKYLEFILDKLDVKYKEIEKNIRETDLDIRKMNDYYWENYAEMDEYGYENYDNIQALKLSADTNEENRKTAAKIRKMKDAPFFGSFDFRFEDEEKADSFYIGIGNFVEKKGQIPLIYDWRAPVCSLYYDYDKGHAQYEAPGGIMSGEIITKVQYKIRSGKMIYEVENDFNIDDEILREELSKNSDIKLKNIIRTIQKEQNSIIRNKTDRYLLIQGCAGSGKTSIALHRIAYLLYHDRERLKSSNVLILSPNGVFSDYIAHILPELGEERIKEMNLDMFAYFELKNFADDCENKYEHLEKMIALEKEGLEKGDLGVFRKEKAGYEYKQSAAFINELEGFILEMEDWLVDFRNVTFKKYTMQAAYIRDLFYNRYADTPLFTRIEYICERFTDEYITPGRELSEEDEEEIRGKFRRTLLTDDIYVLYSRFLEESGYDPLPDVPKERRTVPYEDVYPMLYLKYRTENTVKHRQVRHLVIDEMQDYTFLQYTILNSLFKCPMTVLGDKAQTMEEENRDVLKFLPKMLGNRSRVLRLDKSYRNTEQISRYADGIIHEDGIQFFEREGSEVAEITLERDADITDHIMKEVDLAVFNQNGKGFETAAILTMTMEEAGQISEKLKEKGIEHSVIDENSTEFSKGITVTPFYYAKGLEFDQVFVKDADERLGMYRKYKYICATRALHELCIFKQERQ